MAVSGDEHDVWIRRIDDNAPDDLGVIEAHVRPGFSAVGGFVNTVAPRSALTVVRFASSDPNDRRIRWGNSNGADGRVRLIFEDRSPRHAAICRFPSATRGGAYVNYLGVGWVGGDVVNAPAHDRRPDGAHLEICQRGLNRRRSGGRLLRVCARNASPSNEKKSGE